MGRSAKQVGTTLGVDRRDSGYYATPDFVAEFLARRFVERMPAGRSALDPCVGRGELALPLAKRGIDVDAFDVLPFELPSAIRFQRQDFIDFYAAKKGASSDATEPTPPIDLPYDFFVANPPYNCHETYYIRRQRARLVRLFDQVGAHNMYSMFLSALIDCAKPGALIGVIALDSFLTSRVHERLRRQILDMCSVHLLLLCPTDLFAASGADVRTCILLLQKGRQFQGEVEVANRPASSDALRAMLAHDRFDTCRLEDLLLSGPHDRHELTVGVPRQVRQLFSGTRLAAKFRCVTGISTGDDRQYLRKTSQPGFTIPFYKNPAARKFHAETNGYLTDNFLELSERIENFRVRNRNLLFQSGLTCSSMGLAFGASYLPPQVTFGVNANIVLPDADAWWLMGYLNSRLATFLVRGILARSNMVTSGYVGRLPLPEFSCKAKQRLDAIARAAYAARPTIAGQAPFIDRVDEIVNAELALDRETIEHITTFATRLRIAT